MNCCGKCERLEEFNKLVCYLSDNGYTFNTRAVSTQMYSEGEKVHDMDQNTLNVYEDNDQGWKIRCSLGSCGYELGLLEEEGLLGTDETIGYLTAQNIIDLIEKKRRDGEQ